MAIKIDYPFINKNVKDSLKEPILIISTEKEKEKIMKELIKDSVFTIDFKKEYRYLAGG